MQRPIFFRAVCVVIFLFAIGVCGTIYAAVVEDPPGSGNYTVTTDPPDPDGPVEAAGGDSIAVNEGATLNSGAKDNAISPNSDGYTITSNGTINNAVNGVGACDADTDNHVITNNGLIDVSEYGVDTLNGNTITNYGTINSYRGINSIDDNTITNNGLIDVYMQGIQALNGNTITNNGTIMVFIGGLGYGGGILPWNSNTVVNNGTIIGDDDGMAPYIYNTITNNGTVEGDRGFSAWGLNTITNNGTIKGRDIGVFAYSENTITNNGTITGNETAVYFSGEKNTLILNPGSTTTGDIEVGEDGGENKVKLKGAGIYVYQFRDNAGANMVVNKKSTGTWSLTNTDITPVNPLKSLEIKGGTLRVDGSLKTTDYTQQEDATLQTGVKGKNNCGTIQVDNTPSLNNGGLSIIPTGHVPDGAQYDVMTSAAGFGTERFKDISDTPVLDFDLTYPNNDTARVTVNRLTYQDALQGGTPNQKRIARNLQKMSGSATGDMADVLLELDSLSGEGKLQGAMDRMSPEPYAGLGDISLSLVNGLVHTVENRLNFLRSKKFLAQTHSKLLYASSGRIATDASTSSPSAYGLWARFLDLSGDLDRGKETFGLDYSGNGMALGGDFSPGEDLVIGVNLALLKTEVEYNPSVTETDIETLLLGVYGSYDLYPFSLDALFSWGRNNYDTYRRITFGGLNRTATSQHRAQDYTACAGVKYHTTLSGLDLVPGLSLQCSHYDADPFTEQGAGALSLDVSSFESDSILTRAGLTASKSFTFKDTTLIPEMSLFWAHEFGNTDREIRARFAGGNAGNFTVKGAEPEEDSALLGAGLNMVFNEDGLFYLRYDGEMGDDFHSHRITFGAGGVF